jgi:hypothetical protein
VASQALAAHTGIGSHTMAAGGAVPVGRQVR